MSTNNVISGSDEAWDEGVLGTDEAFVAVAPDDDEELIREALCLQPISIRLEKSLIEDFKVIAEMNGMSYQPLIRQVLHRFAQSEKNRFFRAGTAEKRKALREENEDPPKHKKVA
ncbi:hypothetical protein RBI14_15650 [Alcaligenaceae bacterium B3P038]|nr:hypothetical protein [Alcaligenaceae bacterium B3P038]